MQNQSETPGEILEIVIQCPKGIWHFHGSALIIDNIPRHAYAHKISQSDQNNAKSILRTRNHYNQYKC